VAASQLQHGQTGATRSIEHHSVVNANNFFSSVTYLNFDTNLTI